MFGTHLAALAASVAAGHRVMLQLEYTSSPYLSPISPFANIQSGVLSWLPYPAPLVARPAKNCSGWGRDSYAEHERAPDKAQERFLRRALRALKKRVTQGRA